MIFGKYINKYYKKYWYALLFGTLSLLAVDYFQLVIPELYRVLINGMNTGSAMLDGVSVPFDMAFLLDNICRPLIGVIVAMIIGRFLWRICFFGSAVKVETDLRREMFAHCRLLSQDYFQRNKVGALMSLFTVDLETIQDCFGSGLLMLADASLLGGMAIYKMASMNLLLTAFSLVPLLFLFAAASFIGRYLEEKWDYRQKVTGELSDFAQESFSGIAVIKAFVREAKELHSFRKLNSENESANVRFVRLAVLMDIAVSLFVGTVTAVILGYGGYLAYEGTFDAGQLVEFIGYFTTTVWPVMAISQLIGMRSRGKASLNRIGELLDTVPDIKDRATVLDISELKGEITFKNLSFRYPGEATDALNDISFKINAGENVGIIGRTGAGKTTLVDLILRTYNVPYGMILLDGYDINDLPISTVRKNAAYVPQDNFLFSDSIKTNIAFASDSDDMESVEKAAILADVDANIKEFDKGYETVLGERGVTVSGGQKQRISIARALMKNAPILILDDSVSAVDVGTEKTILQNLRETRKGKTTILIAHRISTIENMDKIIFLDDGKLVAVGKHEELYRDCKAYRNAVDLQKLDDSGKEGER